MPFTLPELPYAKDALAPHISKETLEYHHDKHHNTYVTNLNTLTAAMGVGDDKLEEVIRTSEGPTFNNAAQVWNHSFYWKCMKPGGGGSTFRWIGRSNQERLWLARGVREAVHRDCRGPVRFWLGLAG